MKFERILTIAAVAAILSVAATPARAQQSLMKASTHENHAAGATAAALLSATVSNASRCEGMVETATLRALWDGGVPTSANGNLANIGDVIILGNPNDIANYQDIRTGGTSAAVNFQCYTSAPPVTSTIVRGNIGQTGTVVAPANGGTGLATMTAHGVLVGEGTGNVAPTAVGATGTVLIGNTGADPTFSATPTVTSETLSATTNQIVLGTTNTVTITSPAPSASRTYTLPDAGAAANIGLFSTTPAAIQGAPQTAQVGSSTYTNATTTFSTITNLSFAIAANQVMIIRCELEWQNNGSTGDYKFQVTGPGSPTAVNVILSHRIPSTATTSWSENFATAFSSAIDPNVTTVSATNYHDTIYIGVVNGSNAGTVALQAALHTAAGTLTVQPVSGCTVQ